MLDIVLLILEEKEMTLYVAPEIAVELAITVLLLKPSIMLSLLLEVLTLFEIKLFEQTQINRAPVVELKVELIILLLELAER